MKGVLLSLLLAPLAAWAQDAAPFSFDTAPGRLPKDVVPLDYDLALVPDVDAHSVRGTESVTLRVRSTTTTIAFDSLNQRLDHVMLDGHPVAAVESDDRTQLTRVTLNRPATPGRHRLTFAYQGRIESQPYGLYTQQFQRPDGSTDTLLSTKLEPTYARRMFPCWDEPAFRARFTLSVTIPARWTTVGNMPIVRRSVSGALATVRFAPTPRMPTYLVELTAGDFAAIATRVGRTLLGLWAIRGQQQDGTAALVNARQILADYNDYFGYPFPLPKLDSIATPGGFTGAMENWGAITYNDQILLVSPSSTVANRERTFSVQAHEMAHQWNGDLVTMGWWDDLWLNESFASWRAAGEVDLRHPDWRWWESEDAGKQAAMAADARPASHAIRQHITNELEARSAFDPQITYTKGEAVLRMLEAYVGADAFRDGIRRYMKSHAYSNATTMDLWLALDRASGRAVSQVAAGWTGQPGYPLVTAVAGCDASGNRHVTLTQQRFLMDAADPGPSRWRIPMGLRTGAGGPSQPLLLVADGQVAAAGRCDEPLSLNADAIGYYRVAYDAATLETDRLAWHDLRSGDRIALLDDQWALVQAGRQQLARYLGLAEALGSERNDREWSQVIDALVEVETYERGTPGHDAFTAYARSLLMPLADALGWDARPEEGAPLQHLRRQVLRQLGQWGDAGIVAEARRRFNAFLADPIALAPDDQSVILAIVATNADEAAFERLHGLIRTARNEAELERYLTAVVLARDPRVAQRALGIALSPEVPPQADAIRLRMVLGVAGRNPTLAWQALHDHFDQLLAAYPQYGPLYLAQRVPEALWNGLPLDDLEAWLRERIPPEMAPNLARGMQAARFRLAAKVRLVAAADGYIARRKP